MGGLYHPFMKFVISLSYLPYKIHSTGSNGHMFKGTLHMRQLFWGSTLSSQPGSSDSMIIRTSKMFSEMVGRSDKINSANKLSE